MADNFWEADAFATAAAAKAKPSAPMGRAKTTPQDMMLLRDSTAKAEAERAAQRDYASTRKAVNDMNTGPLKAAYLDAITPEQDGGILDKVGGFLGAPLRLFVSDKTMAARDRLKTNSAQIALKGSSMMKGSSSDKDTAIMRTAGVSDYKGTTENNRLLDDAERESSIEQHRASLKAQWINRFGSISAPGPRGLSYEQVASEQERYVNRSFDQRQRGLPKPPPSARRSASGRTVIDINGNPIR
jgi:hypothetical protein